MARRTESAGPTSKAEPPVPVAYISPSAIEQIDQNAKNYSLETKGV